MPQIRPFRGLLYDSEVAGAADHVTAPPYDVISPVDQDRYYRMSPFNVVRLILGKDEPGDDAFANKYTRASSHLRAWVAEGVLKPTSKPSVFPYELEFHLGGGRRRVRGVIVEVGLERWGGSIIPHERTLSGPVQDRLKLLRAVQANLSPVYAVLAPDDTATDLSDLLDAIMSGAPDREMTDEAGTRHRLWSWDTRPEEVTERMRERTLMIADGHHRYTVALGFRDQMREAEGPGPWDGIMMFVVDASAEDPPVLPIHRVILGPAAPPFEGERVRDLAEVLATLRDDDVTYGIAHLDEREIVHRVAALHSPPPTVSALHDQVLDQAGDVDMRYLPDAAAAERMVSAGEATAAFFLPPTKVERVWDVVGRGGKLPQKSTYFWPKPRTGLVIRPLFG